MIATFAVIALLLVGAFPAFAQAPTYKAPRTADGKPDLSGIWQALNEAYWDIEAHGASPSPIPALGAAGAIPPGMGVVEGGPLPYNAKAAAQKKINSEKRLSLDPEMKCYLPGVPRAMYMPHPFQVLQTPKFIMMVHTFAGAVRTVYMDEHKEAPADSWMGWSNGRWEGETLVIDTTGFNGLAWFDKAGNFASDGLHIVERITAASPDRLLYEATIEDKNTFTRPWKMSFSLYRRVERNAQVMEFKCVEFSEDLIYGHLRKQPAK
jgi:hypothetical protein